MNIPRRLDLLKLLKNKSYFLFGPRQTGKSWLIDHTMAQYRIYNLLESETFLRLSYAPQRLREDMH